MLLKVGVFEFDFILCCVCCGVDEILLLLIEFCVFEFMMCNVGQMIMCMMLFEVVWGYYFDFGINLIDVYMGWLCKKIDLFGVNLMIQMVCGLGYMFV